MSSTLLKASCVYGTDLRRSRACSRATVSNRTKYCDIQKCLLCDNCSRDCLVHRCIHCNRQPIRNTFTFVCNYCKCILPDCSQPCAYMSRCEMHVPRCVLCDQYAMYSEKKDRYIACYHHMKTVETMPDFEEHRDFTKFYILSRFHFFGHRISVSPNIDTHFEACAEWIRKDAAYDIFKELRTYLFNS